MTCNCIVVLAYLEWIARGGVKEKSSVVYIGRWLEKQSRKILLGIVIIGENGVLKHLIRMRLLYYYKATDASMI